RQPASRLKFVSSLARAYGSQELRTVGVPAIWPVERLSASTAPGACEPPEGGTPAGRPFLTRRNSNPRGVGASATGCGDWFQDGMSVPSQEAHQEEPTCLDFQSRSAMITGPATPLVCPRRHLRERDRSSRPSSSLSLPSRRQLVALAPTRPTSRSASRSLADV